VRASEQILREELSEAVTSGAVDQGTKMRGRDAGERRCRGRRCRHEDAAARRCGHASEGTALVDGRSFWPASDPSLAPCATPRLVRRVTCGWEVGAIGL